MGLLQFCSRPICLLFRSIEQVLLDLGIEEVHDLAGEGQMDLTAGLHSVASLVIQIHGGDTSNQLAILCLNVQVQLTAHHFVDRQSAVDGVGGSFRSQNDVLGTNAQHHHAGSDVLLLQQLTGGVIYLDHRTEGSHIVLTVPNDQFGFHDVHLGRTNELRYEKLQSVRCENLPEIYDVLNMDDGLIVLEEYIDGITVTQK